MTTIDIAAHPLSETDHRAQLRRAVIASTVGTTIEWYDFLLYSTVTGLVFGKLFFPKSDPLVGVLQAFAIYTVGFIARPIGAMIFGHYGDRIGRKGALIATLLLTGLATFAVGFVPTYEQVGIWGAVILTIIRFIQGVGRRRRMGRLGAAVDGMGAHQRPSRFHHVVAAIGRPGRIAAGEHRGAGVQRDLRRPVPGLGLACPVHAQHHHGRGSGSISGWGYSRPPSSGGSSPKTGSNGHRSLEVIKRQPRSIILTALARMAEQAPVLHLSRLRLRLRNPGSA